MIVVGYYPLMFCFFVVCCCFFCKDFFIQWKITGSSRCPIQHRSHLIFSVNYLYMKYTDVFCFQNNLQKFGSHISDLERENMVLLNEVKKLESQVRIYCIIFTLNIGTY